MCVSLESEMIDYMKYYRVRSERTDWFSHYFTNADELFTEKERNPKVRYITDFWFKVVNISQENTNYRRKKI